MGGGRGRQTCDGGGVHVEMGCTRFVLVYRVAGGSVWVYRWVTHCVGVHGVGVAVGDRWVTWWVYRWETCG